MENEDVAFKWENEVEWLTWDEWGERGGASMVSVNIRELKQCNLSIIPESHVDWLVCCFYWGEKRRCRFLGDKLSQNAPIQNAKRSAGWHQPISLFTLTFIIYDNICNNMRTFAFGNPTKQWKNSGGGSTLWQTINRLCEYICTPIGLKYIQGIPS